MTSHPRHHHALVLGGSVAGLLAARALADHFERVTIVERDELRDDASHRKGVPQGRHPHGLLASGAATLERFHPGLRDALIAQGACSGDLRRTRWIIGGRRLALDDLGIDGVCCTRPLLESELRRRTRALPNVRVRDRHDVLGWVIRDGRVAGARLIGRRDGSAEEQVEAELTVDATGRGSRLPAWLERLGFSAPEEERVDVGMSYTSARVRRRPHHVGGGTVLVVGATPEVPRAAAALAVREEEWIVTLIGYLGARAEPSLEGMRAMARDLAAPDMHELLCDTELVSEVSTFTFPTSRRRRYERLRRHPEGVIAFGDALCSFNPIFGQGMTVAAHEALALSELLAADPRVDGLWRRFYARARPLIDAPWSMAVGNDLRVPGVEGPRPPGAALLDRYLDRLLAVAERDATLGTAFLRVTNLLEPPSALMRPGLILRTLFPSSSAQRAARGHGAAAPSS